MKAFLLFWIAFAVGSWVGTLDQVVLHPGRWFWTPVALLNIVVHRCHFVFNILRADLFTRYSDTLVPSWLFLGLLALELAIPGAPWRVVGWFSDRIVHRIRAFTPRMTLGGKDGKAIAVLAVLVIAAVVIGVARYREGLVGLESLFPAAVVILRMYLLPLGVLVLLIRWTGRSRRDSFLRLTPSPASGVNIQFVRAERTEAPMPSGR